MCSERVVKLFALGCTVLSTMTRARFCGTRRPDARSARSQQLQLGAEPAAPMAQIGVLVRKGVLEELLAGEVLEIRVIDPTLADLLIGQCKDLLEQQQP